MASPTAADRVQCDLLPTSVGNSITCVTEGLDVLVVECSFDGGPFQRCRLNHHKSSLESEIFHVITGKLPVAVSFNSEAPGSHAIDIRLVTLSGTFSDTLQYSVPNGATNLPPVNVFTFLHCYSVTCHQDESCSSDGSVSGIRECCVDNPDGRSFSLNGACHLCIGMSVTASYPPCTCAALIMIVHLQCLAGLLTVLLRWKVMITPMEFKWDTRKGQRVQFLFCHLVFPFK